MSPRALPERWGGGVLWNTDTRMLCLGEQCQRPYKDLHPLAFVPKTVTFIPGYGQCGILLRATQPSWKTT